MEVQYKRHLQSPLSRHPQKDTPPQTKDGLVSEGRGGCSGVTGAGAVSEDGVDADSLS